jgi:ribosomal protein S18 acetylase RimI-like enzyme
VTAALSSPFVSGGGELRLSNPGQLELLRGVLERGVPLRTAVRGVSMSPFIRDGDVVTFAPMAGLDPAVGDIVAVALPSQGRMAVHRVVARLPQGWLVRGDNCAEPDGVFAGEAFVGRVIRVERGGRDVRLGLRGQGPWVATLSREGWLTRVHGLVWRLRRAAGRILGLMQGMAVYRSAAGRLAPACDIAEAGQADLEVVRRWLSGGAAPPPAAARLRPDVIKWVAQCRGRVVGFVELVPHTAAEGDWQGWWLFSLVVRRPYRGLGIGQALTHTVVERARAVGAAEVLLVVREGNGAAVRLYEKCGFRRVDLPGVTASWGDDDGPGGRRITMKLEVRPLTPDRGRPAP